MTNNVSQVTDRLASSETGMQPWLWLPLLKLLALGDPVDAADLAAATGRPVKEVRDALAAMPDAEYDGSGRIVGMGLTQRPTRHRFEVDGEQLYTWCALDTLIFPTLLDASARIESAYDSASTPVRLRAGSSGVTSVEPATAVVSLINPEDITSVRSSFCNQVHFFASPEEAEPWLKNHPEGTVIPVADAYRLASDMAGKMLSQTNAQETGKPGTRVNSCSC
ncbi:organomercurial lyase MerB [Pseudarthrobacter oxydans]|uniref:organomercurial lyase MerB n=1 Tax=Pseudarthrobacter oxydans TaxID=1671 RepID=UPI001571C26B|nr:organomercurial lyase MerB [Pseudarthrobacter oxydans]NSX38899.1 organomercurial lyase MerB [Pseudarthrobacter oxydans]